MAQVWLQARNPEHGTGHAESLATFLPRPHTWAFPSCPEDLACPGLLWPIMSGKCRRPLRTSCPAPSVLTHTVSPALLWQWLPWACAARTQGRVRCVGRKPPIFASRGNENRICIHIGGMGVEASNMPASEDGPMAAACGFSSSAFCPPGGEVFQQNHGKWASLQGQTSKDATMQWGACPSWSG